MSWEVERTTVHGGNFHVVDSPTELRRLAKQVLRVSHGFAFSATTDDLVVLFRARDWVVRRVPATAERFKSDTMIRAKLGNKTLVD